MGEKSKHYEAAKDVVNEWMNFIDPANGEDEDYSCNQCQRDCYLCPHLHERLVQGVAAAMEKVSPEVQQ